MVVSSHVEAPPTRRRFDVDEYYRLGEAGILAHDERTELIDGEIFVLSPPGPTHAATVDRLNVLFVRAVGDQAIVRVQNPVRLSGRTEPQPDLALLRPRAGGYTSAHPGPDDTLLAVEVAVTSHAYDRNKLRYYAAAGVPEVWIIDVPGGLAKVHRSPHGEGYADVRTFAAGERVAPAAFPDLQWDAAMLLGRSS